MNEKMKNKFLMENFIEEQSKDKKQLMHFMNSYLFACIKEKDIPENMKDIWLDSRNFFTRMKKIKFQEFGGDNIDLIKRVFTNLSDSKDFLVSDKIIKSLWFTNNEIKKIYPPFESIFLDIDIKLNEYQNLCGLLMFNDDKENINSYIITFVITDSYGKNFNENFSIHSYAVMDDDKNNINKNSRELFNKIVNFSQSFLNFIYNPEVEIVKKEYSSIRIKRKSQQGKVVRNHYYLKLRGKVRVYIDCLYEHSKKIKYQRHIDSWIVRGHYKKLISTFWTFKYGQEIFISPFVKGYKKQKLDKYNKKYILSEKKEWFNEMYMTSLVRKIFPQYIILENTRGILDSLELDCYIPSLRIGFEYDGEQHYNFPNAFHKTKKDFIQQQKRDKRKNKLCKELKIKLIRIRYDEEITEDLLNNKLKQVDGIKYYQHEVDKE